MKKTICITALLALYGCQESLHRSDRISPYAGDALAQNYSNQMVDPWPYYVYDTDIETSSERQAAVRKLYRIKFNKDDKSAAAGDPLFLMSQPPASGMDPATNAQSDSQ